MKRAAAATVLALLALVAAAQESQTAYNFLRLPASAHVAALGGDNITIGDDDASLIFHNPALLSGVSDRSLCLGFMTYMEGAAAANAAYVAAAGERATWGVLAQYMDYGTMSETTAEGRQTGDFSAKDVAVGGSLAYALGEGVTGAVTAKLITSSIGQYNSLAAGVDLGLNYYDPERGLSLSAVARNLGGQLSAYEDDFERMPLDLQLGATKRLTGSPLRLSASLTRLNDWQQGLGKHLVVGADVMLSEQFYVAVGYNALRASEMKISEDEGASAHGAGLSVGAGLQLKRLKLNAAYAKYHVSASSLLVNVSYSL